MSGSDTHMINLWNLIQFAICIALGFIIVFYILLLWFDIYLYLVTANKI
jgi:hypothetical protein